MFSRICRKNLHKKAILFDYIKDSYYVLYPEEETSDIKNVLIHKRFAFAITGLC